MCGPQSQKYLFPGPQKKFADSYFGGLSPVSHSSSSSRAISPLPPLPHLSPGLSLSEHLVQEASITKISHRGRRNEDLLKAKVCSS